MYYVRINTTFVLYAIKILGETKYYEKIKFNVMVIIIQIISPSLSLTLNKTGMNVFISCSLCFISCYQELHVEN